MKNYLTTNKLQQQIIDLGFKLESTESLMLVKDDHGCIVTSIRINGMYAFDTVWDSFCELDADVQQELYDLFNRYACTPLDKRVREKKYQLKLDVSNKIDNHWQILAKNTESGALQIGSGRGSEVWQTVFTQAEIDAMGDLTKGFAKEEVYSNDKFK